MVKVIGPLHCDTALGRFGQRIVFSMRKTGAQVRYQRAQKDYENPARKKVRDAFRQGVILWKSLPKEEKALWALY